MRSRSGLLAVCIAATIAGPSPAQLYPGPFLGGGWGGWGSGLGRDPGADYLRGIGYYRRAAADAEVQQARASRDRAEAFAAWNKALGEARHAREIREARDQARAEVDDAIRNRAALVESGDLLNRKLDHIIEFPADGTRGALAAIPLDADALRDVPFENASEPVTACLSALTQEDGWPTLLKESTFDDEREAFAKAVDAALREDLSGPISEATRADLDAALGGLRGAIRREDSAFSAGGVDEADRSLRTLGGMIRLLEDPQGGAVFRQLETFRTGTMADLVGFMHAYNLRFGRATGDRQKATYRQLDALLAPVPVAQSPSDEAATRPLLEHGKLVGDAAKQLFSDLSWDDLDAASKPGG